MHPCRANWEVVTDNDARKDELTRIQKIQLGYVALLIWRLLEFDHHASLRNDDNTFGFAE